MRYKKLGNSDINVSVVGLGTWAMGGDFWGAIDDKEAVEAIHAAIDHGVTLIDTAPIYGKGYSESLVGKGIKGKRANLVIATKCGLPWTAEGKVSNDLSPANIVKEVEASLTRLGTDFIDLYQCHWPDKIGTPIADTMGALMKLKEQGKIRAIGVSNFSVAQMGECLQAGVLHSAQPQFSLLHRDIEGDGVLDYCVEHDIGILSYGSLAGGALTGKFTEPPALTQDRRAAFYDCFSAENWPKTLELVKALTTVADAHGKPVSQAAINWVTQQRGITSALVGARNAKQATANAEAADWMLTDAELKFIGDKYAEIFGK